MSDVTASAVEFHAIMAAFTLSSFDASLTFAWNDNVAVLPIKPLQFLASIICTIPNFLLVVSTSKPIPPVVAEPCVTSTISLPSEFNSHLSRLYVSSLLSPDAKVVPLCATKKFPFIMALSERISLEPKRNCSTPPVVIPTVSAAGK